jgi:tetratricopeptide (TPR) repeat protein
MLGALVVIVCWFGAQQVGAQAHAERKTWPDTEGYIVLPRAVEPLARIGYRQLVADILWTYTTVYAADYSREQVTQYRYLEQLLDRILELDPKFERVYKWAAFAVMYKNGYATQDEYRKSVEYLERGIEQFPDRYELYWIAGIRYFANLHSDDPEQQRRFREKGASLIEQAMHKPDAPTSLATLAASLRVKLGQKQRALHDLRQVILTIEDEKAQAKLIRRYNALAGEQFPEEERRAKREFEARWRATLPYASPSMFVLLGERPSPVIDFEALATERDLFGAEPEPASDAEPEPASDADARSAP